MKDDEEFKKFDKVMDGLLSVPYTELQEKLEQEKRDKEKQKKKRSKVPVSSRVSDDGNADES